MSLVGFLKTQRRKVAKTLSVYWSFDVFDRNMCKQIHCASRLMILVVPDNALRPCALASLR